MKVSTGPALACAVVLGFILGAGQEVLAGMITFGLQPGDFDNPTIERFQGPPAAASSYDFGNGMTHLRLTPGMDWINLKGQTYGLGPPWRAVIWGREGTGDGFFGVGGAPSTYQLGFSPSITQFGFYGAEAWTYNGAWGNDGIMHMEFYDASDALIDAIDVDTDQLPAWTEFYGFESDTLVSRVLWRESGHMVLDDVHFGRGAEEPVIPEPCTLALLSLGVGLAGLARRRRARAA